MNTSSNIKAPRYEVEWHYEATVWGHYRSFKTMAGALRYVLRNVKREQKSLYNEPLTAIYINEVQW
jgi:type IV secretory pathway TrbF-like protein